MNSPTPSPAATQPATRNRRILLVDDTREIHEDFRKILGANQTSSELDALEADLFGEENDTPTSTDEPFELDSAYQGEEALAMVKAACAARQPYAMAFVDVRMPPGWDGIQTLAELWKVDPNLQAVICTAYSDYSWEETFATLGQSDRLLILKKPFDPIEVEQLANALTQKWQLALKARMTMGQMKKLVEKRTATVQEQKQQLERRLKELEETRLQLIQAEKLASVGQLAAGVAHEINNPIGFIRSNVTSLNGYIANLKPVLDPLLALPDDDQQRLAVLQQIAGKAEEIQLEYLLEDVNDIVTETTEGLDRISKIVSDLHSFSHVNDGTCNRINLNKTLDQALSILAPQLQAIEVQQKLTDIPEIAADGARISNACTSLLQNAIDAVQANATGRIVVATSKTETGLQLSIVDNGKGISETNLPRIFDPFFTTKDVGEGTGLGLHTVQQLVTELGGTIQARSIEGKGTRITLQLPAESME